MIWLYAALDSAAGVAENRVLLRYGSLKKEYFWGTTRHPNDTTCTYKLLLRNDTAVPTRPVLKMALVYSILWTQSCAFQFDNIKWCSCFPCVIAFFFERG